MALFKQFRGSRSSLDSVAKHDGHAYFCTDDGSFHIDYIDADGNLQRKQIGDTDLAAKAVTHTQQDLTDEQKAQARENIGAIAQKTSVSDNGKVLTVVDGEASWEHSTSGVVEYNRISVRDYGAVGDGVADDRQAIVDAFNAAKAMLPCEVYFPTGTYGISNGITVYMDYGTGGLRVRGAGRDNTTIKYLDSYNPRRSDIHWYAIRIWPVGMPDTKPTSEDEYLHDISYMGLTVYDPDPCAHATHASKGDSTQEETHGFDLHYCKGVSVTDCQFITVGDEAIDICACRDVVVMNNRLIGSPGAGPGGGAISINDGCNGVVVSGNTINGSAPNEVLPDGTVITKKNNGIAIESLSLPVCDVTIVGNSIRNMHGVGVKMYTTVSGTGVDNIIVANNIISCCDYGIITEGTILKSGIKIHNNLISDCTANAMDMIGINDMSVCGNTFRNISGDKAVKATLSCGNSTQLYADNLFENIGMCAMYVSGTVFIKDCIFNGVGTTEAPPSSLTDGAIHKYGGVLTVSGCTLKNIRLSGVKNGINNANYIEHTDIELISKSGTANAGGDAITGADVTRVIGGVIGGRIAIKKDRGVVRDVTVTSTNIGDHAITISANYVTVTGCNVETNKVSTKGAIGELSGYNYNLIVNNIANQNIITVGANTVAMNMVNGAWIDNTNKLPSTTTDDNGKMLQVVNGAWTAVSITDGNEVAY